MTIWQRVFRRRSQPRHDGQFHETRPSPANGTRARGHGDHELPVLARLTYQIFGFAAAGLAFVAAVMLWVQFHFLDDWALQVARAAMRSAATPARMAIELLDNAQAEKIVTGLLNSGNFVEVVLTNDYDEVMARASTESGVESRMEKLLSLVTDRRRAELELPIELASGQSGLLRGTISIGPYASELMGKLMVGTLVSLVAMILVIVFIHRRGTARLLAGIEQLRRWATERRQRETLRLASRDCYQFEEILELGIEFDETVSLLEKGMRSLAEQQESFERLSITDPMTRLYNRRQLDRIPPMLEGNTHLLVVFLDVDDFKRFNERYGHTVGDRVLRFVADEIMRALGPMRELGGSVFPIRYGGDEFLVVAGAGDLPPDRLRQAVERFHEVASASLMNGISLFGQQIRIGITAGFAIERLGSRRITAMIDDATFAMRLSKARMKGQLCNLSSSGSSAFKKQKLIRRDIESALASTQLFMVYQPIFECSGCSLSGFEALVRWNHPESGQFMPLDFIGFFERGPLAGRAAFKTIELVTSDLARLRAWNLWGPGLRMSFNLSAEQLLTPGLIEHFEACCRQHVIDGRSLQLEITETVEHRDEDEMCVRIQQFHDRGVSIALDDFGAGYSVLNVLLKMPFDKLKLDRSLVDHSIDIRRSTLLLNHLTSMCRDLGVATVCEGVEVEEQFERVRRSGCDEVQGYLFGGPAPIDIVSSYFEGSFQRFVQVA
ncbi:MAG: EAL domain-containing protein [Geminicoccaceae bacterium]|nr:EAL domain-containing protein [Geminicoccaceae bacterium]